MVSNTEKRAADLKRYYTLGDPFLMSNPLCMARLSGCTFRATQIHHKAGRKNWRLLYTPWFFPICHSCHEWATEHSKQAIELGISLSINTPKPADADQYD